MACRHKLHSYLHPERLHHEPSTLILGTFDPEWATTNAAEWFNGRTAILVEDVLPVIRMRFS